MYKHMWICTCIIIHTIHQGETVLGLCRTIPHGVLCFFPSYSLMDKVVRYFLQRTAARCSTLQHAATRCNTLQHTALRFPSYSLIDKVVRYFLQLSAAHCCMLQHTATRCSTLQHTAAHCNTLPVLPLYGWGRQVPCASLCRTLQHAATHYCAL